MKDQNEKITKLESEVSPLQKHDQFLKQATGTFALHHDKIEQYGLRQCLLHEGVPVKENESPSDVLNFVKSCAKEAYIDAILPNKPRSFQNTNSCETGVSDYHHMITTFLRCHLVSLNSKTIFYRDYKMFNENNCLNPIKGGGGGGDSASYITSYTIKLHI